MSGNVRGRDAIQEIVKRLVVEYTPRRVILFGSYACGQPHEDSDIDLLIIKDTDECLVERLDKVR